MNYFYFYICIYDNYNIIIWRYVIKWYFQQFIIAYHYMQATKKRAILQIYNFIV